MNAPGVGGVTKSGPDDAGAKDQQTLDGNLPPNTASLLLNVPFDVRNAIYLALAYPGTAHHARKARCLCLPPDCKGLVLANRLLHDEFVEAYYGNRNFHIEITGAHGKGWKRYPDFLSILESPNLARLQIITITTKFILDKRSAGEAEKMVKAFLDALGNAKQSHRPADHQPWLRKLRLIDQPPLIGQADGSILTPDDDAKSNRRQIYEPLLAPWRGHCQSLTIENMSDEALKKWYDEAALGSRMRVRTIQATWAFGGAHAIDEWEVNGAAVAEDEGSWGQ